MPRAAALVVESIGNQQQALGLDCPATERLALRYFLNLRAATAPPGGLGRVRALELHHCPGLGVAAINEMIQQCPALQHLALGGVGAGDRAAGDRAGAGVALVLRHAGLRRLEVEWDGDKAVHLERVDLGACPQLTDLSLHAPKRAQCFLAWGEGSLRLPPAIERVAWGYNCMFTEMFELMTQLPRARRLEWHGYARRRAVLQLEALEELTLTLLPTVRTVDLTHCPRLRRLRVLRHRRARDYGALRALILPPGVREVHLPPECPRIRECLQRRAAPRVVAA